MPGAILISENQVVPQLDKGPEEGARPVLKKNLEDSPGPFSFFPFVASCRLNRLKLEEAVTV
jgi:hypothetical protein